MHRPGPDHRLHAGRVAGAAAARTEAFTWLTGAVALGQAAAATSAGQLADGFGPSTGFLVPLAGTALALTVLLALRAHLLPRPSSGAAGSPAHGAIAQAPAVSDDRERELARA